MVVGALRPVDTELDQQPAYFCVGKAGAYDRAMHAVMHVPDRRAPFGGRRGESSEDSSGPRTFMGIMPRETAGAAGCRPFANRLDSKSEARDDMHSRYIS